MNVALKPARKFDEKCPQSTKRRAEADQSERLTATGVMWRGPGVERHSLAQLDGAHRFGFARGGAERRGSDIHQVPGELAGIAGRARLENRRGRFSRLGMLIHVRCSSCDYLARPACCRISVRYPS